MNDCHLAAYRKAGFNPVAIASRQRSSTPRPSPRATAIRTFTTATNNCWMIRHRSSRHRRPAERAARPDPGRMPAADSQRHPGAEAARDELCRSAATRCRLVRQAGIMLAVNQNMRYDQSVRAGKDAADDNGQLGEPVLATIDMRGIPHWMPWQAEMGWVTLRIMSIHHLDTFRYWFGDPGADLLQRPARSPDPVPASGRDLHIHPGVRRTASGAWAWTILGRGQPKEGCPSDIYLRWRLERLDGLAMGEIGWVKDPYTTPSTLVYARRGDPSFQRPIWTESWFPDAFIGTMAQLLVALETNSVPMISGRDNLKTMALVDAAYLSAEQHVAIRPVDIANHFQKRRFAVCQGPSARGHQHPCH